MNKTSETTPSLSLNVRLPLVDGLRAIAILLVLGWHQMGRISGAVGTKFNGWVGVDLFFVISGFLITSILLNERARKGSFSIKDFYIRRWLRIFPAYYFFLAFMLGGSLIFHGVLDAKALAVVGLYLTNLDVAFGWGLVPAGTALLPTWSLCIEEQFYTLFPVSLMLVGRRVAGFSVAVIAAVYVWRLWLVAHGASVLRLCNGFDTKIDSIMFGVLAAQLCRTHWFKTQGSKIIGRAHTQIGLAALVALSCLILGYPPTDAPSATIFWGLKLPLTLAAMTLLLVSLLSNQLTGLSKLLSSGPMVWVGRLSYSLYLWHMAVSFPLVDRTIFGLCHGKWYLCEIANFALCFGLAAASYNFVEKPFLKLKERFSSASAVSDVTASPMEKPLAPEAQLQVS